MIARPRKKSLWFGEYRTFANECPHTDRTFRIGGLGLTGLGSLSQTARSDILSSYGTSLSLAKGISGGTFLSPIDLLQGANEWALEDHDQTNPINTADNLLNSIYPIKFANGFNSTQYARAVRSSSR
jgi:hypothetical protein